MLTQNPTEPVGAGERTRAHLQVCADEGLLSSVVEVVPHEEVQQLGGLRSDGAQLRVAALEDLVAQSGTHVGPPFVERRGELGKHQRARVGGHQCSPSSRGKAHKDGHQRGLPPRKLLTL